MLRKDLPIVTLCSLARLVVEYAPLRRSVTRSVPKAEEEDPANAHQPTPIPDPVPVSGRLFSHRPSLLASRYRFLAAVEIAHQGALNTLPGETVRCTLSINHDENDAAQKTLQQILKESTNAGADSIELEYADDGTKKTISHDWQEETPEAKARWFQSLSLTERMDLLCCFTDLILSHNPKIAEQKDAQPIEGRVRVLTGA